MNSKCVRTQMFMFFRSILLPISYSFHIWFHAFFPTNIQFLMILFFYLFSDGKWRTIDNTLIYLSDSNCTISRKTVTKRLLLLQPSEPVQKNKKANVGLESNLVKWKKLKDKEYKYKMKIGKAIIQKPQGPVFSSNE